MNTPENDIFPPENEPNNDLTLDLAWTKYADLNSREYADIHDRLQATEHVTPLRYEQGDQSVTLIASRNHGPNGEPLGNHDYNPGSTYHTDLDTVFEHYLGSTPAVQRIGIVEGTRRVSTTRDEAIRNGSESGHLDFAAAQNGMEIISGEPNEAELHQELFKAGVSKTELAALYTAWSLGSVVRREGSLENLGPHIIAKARQAELFDIQLPTEDERSRMTPEQITGLLGELNAEAINLVPQLNVVLGKEWFGVKEGKPVLNLPDETQANDVALESAMADAWWPNRPGRVNEVCGLANDLRDKHLFRLVADQIKQGKSPIVPFGSTHVARLKPCFDVYFGQEPTPLDVVDLVS